MAEAFPTVAAPSCPGPDPHPRGPTRFQVPAGAVDAHAHVIGLPPEHPFVEGRSYPPAPASAYLDMLDATGMAYGVLIQVSVHGTRNELMIETLRAHPDRLRGIAVIAPDTPARELQRLKDDGVVGLRLNVLYGGGVGFEAVEAYGANDYERDVFNGDLGLITGIDTEEGTLTVSFEGREVEYGFGELDELVLAYATTIHKAQGSEYPVVVIPLVTQHYAMLARNLLYTGVTRGKRLVVIVGQRKALAMAVRNGGARRRWSKLREWLLPATSGNSAKRRTTLAQAAENV